jgi:hypothetical protein
MANKMGPLSRAMPTPSQIQANSWTSPKEPSLNLSYSQVIKTSPNLWAYDPGKRQVIRSPDQSHDPSVPRTSCDQAACDPGKPLDDLPRDWLPIWSPDHVNFRCAMHPLINTWKTMGTVNKDNIINNITRLRRPTAAQSIAGILSHFDHLCTINQPALKGSLPVTCIRACPKAVHRPPCISI